MQSQDSVSIYSNKSTISRLSSLGRPKLFGEHFNRYTNNISKHTSHESIQEEPTNYALQRIDTRKSVESLNHVLAHSQYRVSLHLTTSEISLIRYTWNKMLLDDPIEKQSTFRNIPGAYPVEQEIPKHKQPATSASSIASSLFCRQFYDNLLMSKPDLEEMFPSIRHQAVQFAGVMAMTISQLEDLTLMDEYLMKLGKRHSRVLGIGSDHFELMGEVLILTFQERFGTRFTQELAVLWIRLYLYLANTLLQFGVDPVMRLPSDLSVESEFNKIRTMSSVSSLMNERPSISTSVTSLASTETNTTQAGSVPHSQKSSPMKTMPGSMLKAERVHSLGMDSIRKKKKDCVIQ